MIVYKLTFSNGKSYIGQTMRVLAERVREHRKASNDLPVARAFRRYGEPRAEIIATASSLEELNAFEVAAIIEHGTMKPGGYNLCEGGKPAPMRNPEVAARVGAKLKGRVFSDEVRAKMSASAKLRIRPPRSAETCARLSASLKAAWSKDDRSRNKAISVAVKKMYDEKTPEQRQAFSEARKRAWETRRCKQQEK